MWSKGYSLFDVFFFSLGDIVDLESLHARQQQPVAFTLHLEGEKKEKITKTPQKNCQSVFHLFPLFLCFPGRKDIWAQDKKLDWTGQTTPLGSRHNKRGNGKSRERDEGNGSIPCFLLFVCFPYSSLPRFCRLANLPSFFCFVFLLSRLSTPPPFLSLSTFFFCLHGCLASAEELAVIHSIWWWDHEIFFSPPRKPPFTKERFLAESVFLRPSSAVFESP